MALGTSGKNRPWRVSVDRPEHGSLPGEATFRTLELNNRGVATSGDYRNYYEDHGRAYSHIIDPRSGYPVSNRVASATVIAADCMTADALATAMIVVGPEDGIQLLEAFRPAEAMWIMRKLDGSFEERYSAGFPASSD
jgi:thiamine biosynthesis lipoprotein